MVPDASAHVAVTAGMHVGELLPLADAGVAAVALAARASHRAGRPPHATRRRDELPFYVRGLIPCDPVSESMMLRV